MTEDIVHQGVKVVNWIIVSKNLIRNHHTGICYCLKRREYVDKGEHRVKWDIRVKGQSMNGPFFPFEDTLFTDTEAEARAAFERIATRLGAVDLLAERTSDIQATSAEWARVIKSSDMHKPPDVIYIRLDSDGLPEVYYTLPAESHCMAYIRVEYLHAAADKALERTEGVEFSHGHRGDPCEFCGVPHDDVAVGDCPGYPNDKIELTSDGAKP